MIKYAPHIDGTIPAFTNDGIIVPFQPNLAVAEGAAAGMVLMIKDLNGNILEYKESTKVENNIAEFTISSSIRLELNEYTAYSGGSLLFILTEGEYIVNKIGTSNFIINNEDKELTYSIFPKDENLISNIAIGNIVEIKNNVITITHNLEIGQYYKIQLAYKDRNTIKENYSKLTYSSVGITKYIGNANINIESVDSKKLQYNYECLDSTEPLYSLQTTVYKGKFKKIEKEDTMLQLDDVSSLPHKVKIKIASKNLLDLSKAITEPNASGRCSFVNNNDGTYTFTKIGTHGHRTVDFPLNIKANTSIMTSVNLIETYSLNALLIYFNYADNTGKAAQFSYNGAPCLFIAEKDVVSAYLYVSQEVAENSKIVMEKAQIELGSTASEYTPYIPTESGKGSLYFKGVYAKEIGETRMGNSDIYTVDSWYWSADELYIYFDNGNQISVSTNHLSTVPEELPIGTQLYYDTETDSLYRVVIGLISSTITISDSADLYTMVYTIDDTLTIEATSISPIMNIFSEFTQGILLSAEFLQGEVTQVFQFISSLNKENILNFPFQLLNGSGYLIELLGTTINNYTLPLNQTLYYKENNTKDLTTISNIQKNYEYGEIVLPPLNDSTLNYIRINSIYDKNYAFVSSLDNTVEHGKNYYYGVINNNGDWLLNTTDSIVPYFEDMFLQDATHSLRIKFNPKISSFKKTIQESKIDTLGSQYPYFFRNGDMNYAEFPISGLLTYWMGDSGKFGYDWEYGIIKHFEGRRGEDGTVYGFQSNINSINIYQNPNDTIEIDNGLRPGRTTNLVDYNIAAEREYKMKVLEWLNNGQPKLFRSPTEGNFVVRLMNISLTPEERLGRMLHSFNCTAYECAAADYETLVSLRLVPGSEAEK